MVQSECYDVTTILFVCKENKNNSTIYSTIHLLRVSVAPFWRVFAGRKLRMMFCVSNTTRIRFLRLFTLWFDCRGLQSRKTHKVQWKIVCSFKAVQAWNAIHFFQKKCTCFHFIETCTLKGTCFHFKQIIYICSTENPAAVIRNVLGGFGLVITATMHIYKQLFLESGTTDRD